MSRRNRRFAILPLLSLVACSVNRRVILCWCSQTLSKPEANRCDGIHKDRVGELTNRGIRQNLTIGGPLSIDNVQ